MIKFGLAQINATVGDFEGNVALISQAYRRLAAEGAGIVVTPELALTGYPPQDLIFKSQFVPKNLEALQRLHGMVQPGCALVVGFIDPSSREGGRGYFNAAAILEAGKPQQVVHKSLLPTYDVFDEARYFEPARKRRPIEVQGVRVGVTICEDLWTASHLPRDFYHTDPVAELVAAGSEVILNLSASPFAVRKPEKRQAMVQELAKRHDVPIVYCNAVGGNDHLVFDGNSFAVGASGEVVAKLPGFASAEALVDLAGKSQVSSAVSEEEEVHDALVLGVRDYIRKCGFKSCVLGLSGGIDSAVVACLAVEALGAEHVLGVAMPGPYSSSGSVTDALELAKNLGIRCLTIPIQASYEAMNGQLAEAFHGLPADVTEENLQSRLRGISLMALSNKFGSILLTTGNKSELAVGYCTIYGDMCGGLAVISDVPKTMVYRLATYINRERVLIPESTISKPPSAELRPDQTDQDTLPPYELLDEILRLYVEENLSSPDIVQRGFDVETVRWIIRKVDLNEYKRKQAAPGLKVTERAFGMGRRIPIAQRFIS